jgi:hypothetical protein
VHREKSLLSSGRRVSEEDTHKVVEHSVENIWKVCIEQKECQEGENNLFSRNPSNLSLTKSQKCKECLGG